jgi:hypothetical protein
MKLELVTVSVNELLSPLSSFLTHKQKLLLSLLGFSFQFGRVKSFFRFFLDLFG